jgi:hypothetical protein
VVKVTMEAAVAMETVSVAAEAVSVAAMEAMEAESQPARTCG